MSLPLIDKQDTFEIIRDRIAEILVLEVANQKALAVTAGKDESLWDLKVFLERSNPWDQFADAPAAAPPIVNVAFDGATFDRSKGDPVMKQASEATYNIDCYGYGVSTDTVGAGHEPGDRLASFAAQRALRLVRNILMAGENAYLGFRGAVGLRWPQSMMMFQPQIDGMPIQNVWAARLSLMVQINEFSPQVDGDILDYVAVTVLSAEDGEVVLEADYDYS